MWIVYGWAIFNQRQSQCLGGAGVGLRAVNQGGSVQSSLPPATSLGSEGRGSALRGRGRQCLEWTLRGSPQSGRPAVPR